VPTPCPLLLECSPVSHAQDSIVGMTVSDVVAPARGIACPRESAPTARALRPLGHPRPRYRAGHRARPVGRPGDAQREWSCAPDRGRERGSCTGLIGARAPRARHSGPAGYRSKESIGLDPRVQSEITRQFESACSSAVWIAGASSAASVGRLKLASTRSIKHHRPHVALRHQSTLNAG